MFLHDTAECVYVCVIFSILLCPVSLHYTGTWLQMKVLVPLAWLCQPHHINPMTNTEMLTGKNDLVRWRERPGPSLVWNERHHSGVVLHLPAENTLMPGLAHTPHFTRDVNKQCWLAPSRPPTAGEARSVAGVTGVYARWAMVDTVDSYSMCCW